MPFTPLHFGVGLLAKGIAPKRVSLTAFVASQILIDCEPAFYLMKGDWPIHRWFHTFAVGVPVALAAGALVFLAGDHLTVAWRRWRATPGPPEVALGACLVGAALGGVTHPILDGMMHWDVRPLRPFSMANPFEHLLSVPALYWLCVAAGVVGVLLLAMRGTGADLYGAERGR